MPQNAGYHQPSSFEVITTPPKRVGFSTAKELKVPGEKMISREQIQAQTQIQMRFFYFWILGNFV